MNSHKEGCGAPIFGEKTCTCVDRWSPQAKLEECGNYTGDMYQDYRGGFVKFSDHQSAIREAILETRKATLEELRGYLIVWRCWNCEHELTVRPSDPFGPCEKCGMDGAGHRIFSEDMDAVRQLAETLAVEGK